ncbi:hypothetical protein [Streptomyces sp. SID13031]|uniref:terpene synthase family protein n=1 Tax=Streptomyces sp. SID13031 TaxID=2706046 RepID=UPI0013C8800B|nr:hypothetical protein [Streptomyces sp. SID13031]NEA36908.1 hypothetical protein [Streptomyces sp. SID13031]
MTNIHVEVRLNDEIDMAAEVSSFLPIGIRVTQLTRALEEWATPYPSILPYVVPVGVAHSFSWPGMATDDLVRGAKSTMWFLAGDHILDRSAMSMSEFEGVQARYRAIADGARLGHGDEFATLLCEIRRDLSQRPLFHAVGSLWREAFDRNLDATLYERIAGIDIRCGKAPPSIDEYLRYARWSFGGDFIHLGRLILTEDRDILPWLCRIRIALRHYSLAGRLANDLYGRSHERDDFAPLNIMMLGADPVWVTKQINFHVDSCSSVLKPLIASGVQTAIGIRRLIYWVTGYYASNGQFHLS